MSRRNESVKMNSYEYQKKGRFSTEQIFEYLVSVLGEEGVDAKDVGERCRQGRWWELTPRTLVGVDAKDVGGS